MDTPSFLNKETGERFPVRQFGVGGAEMGDGTEYAEQDKAYMLNMFSESSELSGYLVDQGRGVFGRQVANPEIDGMDKLLVDLLGTGYDFWGNYGFPEPGTEEYERYKWLDSNLMRYNKEAAQLLKDNPEPTSIISDEDFKLVYDKINSMQELYNGRGNPEQAREAARFLTANRELLNKYLQRDWLWSMENQPAIASQVLSRLDDGEGQFSYESTYGEHSQDIGSQWKPSGFFEGVKLGFGASYLAPGSRMVDMNPNMTELEKLDLFTVNNKDLDSRRLSRIYADVSAGVPLETAVAEQRAAEKTEGLVKFEENSKGFTSDIGVGLGEALGNPTSWALAHPLAKGGQAVFKAASMFPAPVARFLQGAVVAGTEQVAMDLTTERNLSAPEIAARATMTSVGGGALLGSFSLAGAGFNAAVARTKKNVTKKETKLKDLTDLFNQSTDLATSTLNKAVDDVLTIPDNGAPTILSAVQKQQQISRAEFARMDKVKEEIKGFKVPELKDRLRGLYQELGVRGHSKFKTKDSLSQEIQKREGELARNKKANDLDVAEKQSKIDFEQAKLAEEAKAKADLEAAAKTEADAKKAKEAEELQTEEAQKALDLALVNMRRTEKGKKPITADDVEFEAELSEVKIEVELKKAEVDQAQIKEAKQSMNIARRAYDKFLEQVGLRDMTSKGLEMGDSIVKYAATKLLETGAGFAGRANRPASAALIKDTIQKREYSNLMGAYQNFMNDWAATKGLNYWQNINARNVGGANPHANEFHREFYMIQERLAMGDEIEIPEAMQGFKKMWDQSMANLFKEARDAGVPGFGANQRQHYVPRIWKKVKVKALVDEYGEHQLRRLIEESLLSAQRKGKSGEKTTGGIAELVDRQVNWINGLGDAMDEYTIGANNRTKARAPLDMTVSIQLPDGKVLSMIDLVDTNIPTIASTYTHRTAGSVGLARATNGAIRDEAEFLQFASKAESDEAKLFMEDVGNMQFGRPTRDGMDYKMRTFMDAAQNAQLETLGVAQLSSVGTALQAVVANWASNPKVAESIMRMTTKGDLDPVMRSIRERSAVNNNIKFANRADVHHLDQAQLDEITDYSLAMNQVVDKMTGGDLKPLFSRGLGKLSGYDAVAQYQSQLTQASFTTETARQAVLGQSSFTDKRLVDLGVKQIKNGKIVDGPVAKAYKEHVEFTKDGELKDMHFEKWTDDQIREYTYAMNRYEAQIMPYIMNGELPQFMNMPEMQFALHYLKTPLAFSSKGTSRQLGFADHEAALAVALNTMSAGLTRYAYVAGTDLAVSAISGEDVDLTPDLARMKTHNYLDFNGINGDLVDRGVAVYKTFADRDASHLSGVMPPAMSYINDYRQLNLGAVPTLIPSFEEITLATMERLEKSFGDQ